ncbi:glycoside hydrolase family 13 protein [Streptomyces sp. Je 1-79]|uniref:glycoside hydrolase family 13 protein n=1 Tax=Streptomyces sp. Je 1-79 TaxID=2943847 RepID=UPI0021A5F5A0|nr:glycoside hydrolase family 13 protein [Streptomyces sp. Je 1-79]MCT4351799.1 glycoside hydrolase family 13 protein [Streptomyces sp. Je 1-79]
MPDEQPGPWWRGAAIYQIYPRSYADGNGDGVGDIAGIRARLPHLRDLGVDAVWISPWYVSPMADAGYDVADYRDIDPLFGTLADAEALITEAHGLGLRIIVDMVPNHCSDQHPWFRSARAEGPGSPERQLFHFRPGRGASGELPPNDWQSAFGGPAWTRTTAPDGTPGEWYLHLFAPEQPDWNWEHPRVREEFESILRFWLDRGVDGFRIDVASLLLKQEGLPDKASLPQGAADPASDRPEVHEIYRAWRRIADTYEGERIFVGELWVAPDSLPRYLRADELHTGFNFPFMQAPWEPGALRAVIDGTLAQHALVGAPATWVLGSHDATRVVTRYGRADTSFTERHQPAPVDLDLGTRRARAAALLSFALPGAVYVYQGDELGLWEVEDIPVHLRQDPAVQQSGGTDPGRDGCRVPLPWEGDEAPFGFSPSDVGTEGTEATEPWLPQPPAWKDHTVAAESGDPASTLELYRAALHIRRTEPALGDGPLEWLDAADGVLAFTRGHGFVCLVNFTAGPVELPAHTEPLLSSGPLAGGLVPPDTTVWFRIG